VGVLDIFTRNRPKKVSSYYDDHNNNFLPRWLRPPDRNTADWLRAFGTSPRLAVVNRIASDLSFATGKLYSVDASGEENEVTAHPFLDFWKNPNPLYEFSAASLWQLHEIYLLLKGECYFVVEKDALGIPRELWPIPLLWVYQTPTLGNPYYLIRATNGISMNISVDDMFIQKSLNPYDPYIRGLGEAESIADEVETDEYTSKYQKRFFFNDATPNTIVTMPNSSDEQRNRFRQEWMERFKGVFKSHGLATVAGDVKVERIGESMKDMDMIEGRKYLRDSVLEHFGVPREIMGITENSNRATAEAAQFIYAQNVLMPRLMRREEAINTQLVSFFGGNLVWHFDPIVPRNEEFNKARALDGWNHGLLTKDEARELMDMPLAVAGGNIYKTSVSDYFISAEQDPAAISSSLLDMQNTTQAITADDTVSIAEGNDEEEGIAVADGKGFRSGIVEGRAKMRNINLAAAERSEAATVKECSAAFEIAMLKYLREQTNRLTEALGVVQKADNDPLGNLRNMLPSEDINGLVDDYVSGMIDWQKEAFILKKTFEPLWRKAYDAGSLGTQGLYGLQSVKRPELISTAKLRGGLRIANVTQTTKNTVRSIIVQGLQHGESTKTIADMILSETEINSRSRAQLIARQEVLTSLKAGQYDMMRSSGATSKTWHHRPQTNPRIDHEDIDGETVVIDGRFSNGLKYPLDPDCEDAGQVINCRCYCTYNWS